MNRWLISLITLTVVVVAIMPSAMAVTLLEFSISEAVEYALVNNPELKQLERDNILAEKRNILGNDGLKLTVSSSPTWRSADTTANGTLESKAIVHGEKGLLGGKLAGDLSMQSDLLNYSDLRPTISVEYQRSLIEPSDGKVTSQKGDAYETARRGLVSDVFRSYISILRSSAYVDLLSKDVELKKVKVTALVARNSEQKEITVAEDRLATATDALERANQQLKASIAQFKTCLGLSKDTEVVLSERVSVPEVLEPPGDLDSWTSIGMKNNQSVLDAIAMVERAKQQLDEAEAGPGWTADLRIGLNPYQFVPGVGQTPDYYVKISASRTFELASGLDVEETELALDKAQANLDKKKMEVSEQVRDTHVRIGQLQKEVSELQGVLEEAEKELAVTQRKYDVGLIGPVELADAEYRVNDVAYQVLSRYYDSVLELENLKSCVGLRASGI